MDARKLAGAAVLGLLLLAGAFAAGRYSGPTKIVESKTHHETTVKLQDIHHKVDITELQRMVRDEVAKVQKDIARNIHRITRPDGTVEETINETDKSTSEMAVKTDTSTTKIDKSTTDAKLLDQKLTVDQSFKSTETGGRTSWSAGIFATYQPWGDPGFNLLPEQRLQLGLTVGHRIFGPVWADLMLTSGLAFGGRLYLVW